MDAIKHTVQALLSQWRRKQRPCKDSYERYIKKILTKREIKHITLNNFKSGTLTLYLDSSGWLYHLQLKKEQLLKQIQQDCPEVRDMRFFLGEHNEKKD
ncbi:MAG: DciA family protein [Candidatus Omnitrophota bacterium]